MDGGLQEKMRLGDSVDIYYYNSKTLEKQDIRTTQNTRFFQQISNTAGGSSTFIISPDQGVSDIIFALKLPEVNIAPGATGLNGYGGLAVSKAFGYQLVKNVSIRYAGSSQYFFTGDQIFTQNLREMSNPTSRDDLVQLGGTEMKTAADFAGDNLFAYVVLNLPHSSPNGSLEKPNPFPSEILNQPIVITLELNTIPSIFKRDNGVVSPPNAPTQLAEGYFQVRAVQANDRGMLKTPQSVTNGTAYSYPLKAFYQNQIDIAMSNVATSQSLTLTGFRSGDVRSIFFWIENTNDKLNKYNWITPRDIVLSYNGTVIHNFKGTSAAIFDLMGTDVPSNFNNSVLTADGSGVGFSSLPVRTNFTNLPLSQVYEQMSATHLMVGGLKIENAVVNLQLTVPVIANANYVAKFVYSYNSVLLCANGSAEYLY